MILLGLVLRGVCGIERSQRSIHGVQDAGGATVGSFSKGLLEEEWYTPESSLMELSAYPGTAYGMADPRSVGFGLLESTLSFDAAGVAGFRSAGAPSAICIEDLAPHANVGGLFSGISHGKNTSSPNPLNHAHHHACKKKHGTLTMQWCHMDISFCMKSCVRRVLKEFVPNCNHSPSMFCHKLHDLE